MSELQTKEKLSNSNSDIKSEPEKILIIACGALAREILAIIELNQLSHVTLTCLSASLHMYPDKIPGAVREAIHENRDKFDQIFIGYGDCGTGGLLDKVLEEEGVDRLPGAHCYAFFEGVEKFTAKQDEEFTSFYLTDFLARQFETFVIKPFWLDTHPELRDMYFGHYEKLVYMAQTEDVELQKKAEAAAEQLGLEYEYRFTGYGDLTSSILQTANAEEKAV